MKRRHGYIYKPMVADSQLDAKVQTPRGQVQPLTYDVWHARLRGHNDAMPSQIARLGASQGDLANRQAA